MEFIREPELLEINGGWCVGEDNSGCTHTCICDGCYDICYGTDIDVCYCDNDNC